MYDGSSRFLLDLSAQPHTLRLSPELVYFTRSDIRMLALGYKVDRARYISRCQMRIQTGNRSLKRVSCSSMLRMNALLIMYSSHSLLGYSSILTIVAVSPISTQDYPQNLKIDRHASGYCHDSFYWWISIEILTRSAPVISPTIPNQTTIKLRKLSFVSESFSSFFYFF